MDRKARQRRRELGYDADDDSLEEMSSNIKIPVWVFAYSSLASFILGLIGMGLEISSGNYSNYFLLYFSLSFFLAPSLFVYPVFRFILGEGKTEISAILATVFGYYVQSGIKKKIDK
jgi:hypothetical protein